MSGGSKHTLILQQKCSHGESKSFLDAGCQCFHASCSPTCLASYEIYDADTVIEPEAFLCLQLLEVKRVSSSTVLESVVSRGPLPLAWPKALTQSADSWAVLARARAAPSVQCSAVQSTATGEAAQHISGEHVQEQGPR